jgi:CHAD domain-containing protein
MKKSRMAWDPRKSEVENARRVLPVLAARFLEKSARAASGSVSPEDLHPFRLRAKRLRYTLELFQSCYGPGLAERLAVLRAMQNFLGDINDCYTTRQLLEQKHARRRPGWRSIAEFLDRRVEERVGEFRKFWGENFAAPGSRRWWVDYLKRFAGRNHSRRR